MADMRRTDLGFQGGQVLVVRAAQESYDALMKALGEDGSRRWHLLETDESLVQVDLSQVVYVTRESGDQKVGF